MSDGFDQLVAVAQPFFRELAENNNRDWFEPHKDFYNTEIRGPGTFLADLLADELRRATGTSYGSKVYRIYRDVRFAKDKRPFNPWLSLSWSAVNARRLDPAWFSRIEGERIFMGMGVLGLAKEHLTTYRNWVDRDGDEISYAIEAFEAAGGSLSDVREDSLKRVPKLFDPEHPHGDLLRQKGLWLTLNLDRDKVMADGLIPTFRAGVATMMPVWQMMTDDLAGW